MPASPVRKPVPRVRIFAVEVSAFFFKDKEDGDEIQPQPRFFRGLCHTVRRVRNRRIFLFPCFAEDVPAFSRAVGGETKEINGEAITAAGTYTSSSAAVEGRSVLNANARNGAGSSAGSPSAWAIKDRSTVSVPTAKGGHISP